MALKIWISSFIPKDIAGYTKPVPGQAALTMIPGPSPISDCYHTDQRSFSNALPASSRTRSLVELSTTDFALVSESHNCDFTVECDCEDGEQECREQGDKANLKIVGHQAFANRCTFRFEGGAGNPCASGAPEINWSVSVEVTRLANNKMQVAALPGSKVEPFPAFEMYASLDGKPGKEVFKVGPLPGTTPWNLFGDPNRAVSGTVLL